MSPRRKPYHSDLSDEQWNRIKRLLPKPATTGRPREDDREIINGIVYVMWTGCRWEDMPHDIAASPKTCNRRLLEYQRRRVWQKIVASLMKEAYSKGMINLNNCYHDASVIKSKRGQTTKSDTLENTGSKA